MIPTSIDGTDITGATIDGQDVEEITVDGDTVFSAGWFSGFESGNINEFTVDAGSWSVQSSTVFEGSFALTCTSGGTGDFDLHSPDYTLSRGDSIEGYLYLPSGVTNMRTGLRSSANNGYYYIRDQRSGTERVTIVDDGNKTNLTDASGVIATDEWTRLRIDYGSSDIRWRLFDSGGTKINDFTLNDSRFGDVRLAFANDSSGGFWDSWKLL